jgi:hypothetical protein
MMDLLTDFVEGGGFIFNYVAVKKGEGISS